MPSMQRSGQTGFPAVVLAAKGLCGFFELLGDVGDGLDGGADDVAEFNAVHVDAVFWRGLAVADDVEVVVERPIGELLAVVVFVEVDPVGDGAGAC